MTFVKRSHRVLAVLLPLLLCAALVLLERERARVDRTLLSTPAGEVHLDAGPAGADAPLVVIAHGFAGSVQMMQTIARDLALAGFTAARFDFIGHGRHSDPLSPRVTEIDGTTAQLVDQTVAVIEALQARRGDDRPIALVGHSMATDILIRAAEGREDIAAIVAISMYSEAITPNFPQRLLVISGEWEDRLRRAGLNAVRQIEPTAGEGETVRAGDTLRRTVYAPGTEHVGVLYSPITLAETRDWLGAALGVEIDAGAARPLVPPGPLIAGALLMALASSLALLTLVAAPAAPPPPLGPRVRALALLLPIPVAMAAGFLSDGMLGFAGFGALALFLAACGTCILWILYRAGRRPGRPSLRGMAAQLLAGLVFALVLDRYGAAFLPVGQRAGIFLLLLPAALLFMLGDRLLMQGAPLWMRLAGRALPLAALTALMFLRQDVLGLLFTVLPVLLLFWLVYGALAHVVGKRFGPTTAGLAAGISLAWAIAASTPVFLQMP